MKYRVLGLLVAVTAVALVLGTAVAAQQAQVQEKNTHVGKLVSVTGNQFTMTVKGKEHKHTLAPDAKISCDGKTCKLDDIKSGTTITVTTRPNDQTVATRVEGNTKSRDGK